MRVEIVAELGINHNGDMGVVEKMIGAASWAGCDYVKFQTRTLEAVYTPEQMAAPRKSPWGETAGDVYRQRELSRKQYEKINAICSRGKIKWFTTCTDAGAVEKIRPFEPPYFKIASAQLTDDDLIDAVCATKRSVILSTGMSTFRQIREAVGRIQRHGSPLTLLQCTSSYPCFDEELNLRCIHTLASGFGIPVGFSSHSPSVVPVFAAVALGACMVEVHVTLDRKSYGTDQPWSIEPHDLRRMVQGIRRVERSLGDGAKRPYHSEMEAMRKLRRARPNEFLGLPVVVVDGDGAC